MENLNSFSGNKQKLKEPKLEESKLREPELQEPKENLRRFSGNNQIWK